MPQELIELIGLIAGCLTCSALIPQIIKIWKTRSVKDVSILTYIQSLVGVSLWIVYGVSNNLIALIISSTVSLICNIIVIAMKLKWK
jgi:MtN3 and saliva related transmembrane protein